MSDLLRGLPTVGSVTEIKSPGKTTAGYLVQQATYQLSKAIFSFSPQTFELDHAVKVWSKKGSANLDGTNPELFEQETRIGAALALLGYLEKSESAGLVSVVAASGTIAAMEPVLSRHLSELKHNKVLFQVAAVDYDYESGQLIPDSASVCHTARNLGFPLISSSLARREDAYISSVLTAIIANSLGPAIHLYDGIRGTRQAFSAPALQLSQKFSELPKVASLLEAFSAVNKLFGTKLAPFEYHGPAEPSTVFVTLGLPSILARNNAKDGVINVRLYSPFMGEEFLKLLPSSTYTIVVVGRTSDLYKDVNAAVKLHYGFKGGPSVVSEILGKINDGSSLLPEKGLSVRIWDSDKSATATSASKLAFPLPDVNAFTKFDNFVAGGAICTELRLNFENQFWDLQSSDILIVNHPQILKSVDATADLKVGGKLVVAATSDEEVTKLLPGQLKLNAMAKKLEVYRLDYSKALSANTEGRSTSLAIQAAIWQLSGADVDSTTSWVTHANSLEMELIAATVNQIVIAVKEQALARVSDEVLSEWNKVEISDKEKEATFQLQPAQTSFVASTGFSDAETQDVGTSLDDIGSFGLKKRLVFKEAFSESKKLRPEVGSKTAIARVKLNQRVTPDDYDRHIFQLELDISGTGLTYAIGEALGIHAPNNSADVLTFLESYGVDPEQAFGVPAPNNAGLIAYRTAFQIARDSLDLFGKVPKRFYESLATYATDETESAKLKRLVSPEGAEDLKKRSEVDFENYVDVLGEFKSARPGFGDLIEMVAPLKRREYSIASSQKVHPNEVHLLIVVVDWVNSKGEKRYGQCSKFLSDLDNGAEVVVSVKPSVMKLPKDPSTPIIMAGLGTGLAPFKAFLEEKMWQRDQGQKIGAVYLYLGSRHQRQEYLYGELFEAYKAAGILTHIGAAFSRDQPEKIYIQHRIQQSKTELIDAFVVQGGNFYLCGPTWPVPDISAALTDIVLEGSAKTGASPNEATLIEDLKEAERYILEVY